MSYGISTTPKITTRQNCIQIITPNFNITICPTKSSSIISSQPMTDKCQLGERCKCPYDVQDQYSGECFGGLYCLCKNDKQQQ